LDFPNEIVLTGGVSDPNTKKVIAMVVWSDASSLPHNMDIEEYAYNLTP